MLRGLVIGVLLSPLALLALALLGWVSMSPARLLLIIGVPVGLFVLLMLLSVAGPGGKPRRVVPPQRFEPESDSGRPASQPAHRPVSLAAQLGMRREHRGWRYVSRQAFPADTSLETGLDSRESPGEPPPDA